VKSGVKAHRATARRVGLAGLVAATLVTAGCTAGQRAQTADEQETLDGTTAHIGTTITLGALAVEAPSDGSSWASGGNVPVKVVMVNSGHSDDQLTSITSPSITSWSTYASVAAASAANAPGSPSAAAGASSPSPVTVPAHSRVQFGTVPTGATGIRVLMLTGVKSTIYPGSSVALTFTFAQAGRVTVQVPVQLSKTPHSSVIPGPSATGEAG